MNRRANGHPTIPGPVTVGVYLDPILRRSPKLRLVTLRTSQMYVRRYLVPGPCRKRLARLVPLDARTFAVDRRAAGLAPATIRQLHAILQDAVCKDTPLGNVAQLVVVPTGPRHEVAPLARYTSPSGKDVAAGEDGERSYRRFTTTGHQHLVCRCCGLVLERGRPRRRPVGHPDRRCRRPRRPGPPHRGPRVVPPLLGAQRPPVARENVRSLLR